MFGPGLEPPLHYADGVHSYLLIREFVADAEVVGGELRYIGWLDVGVVPNTDQILPDRVEAEVEGCVADGVLGVLLGDIATLLADLDVEQLCLRDRDGSSIQLWRQRHLVNRNRGLLSSLLC